MSISNSGMKEMSSSQVGKSYTGDKEGYTFAEGGRTIEIKPPVVSFEDIKDEYKEVCFELAEEGFRMWTRR